MSEAPNFYILSGGPGSGKSSILEALGHKGYKVVPETGRKIIQEQVEAGGSALPWADKAKFRDLMVQRDIEQYSEAKKLSGLIFFDRGIPDSLGYSKLESIPSSQILVEGIKHHPYKSKVFMTPPWLEIYQNDNERKQTWEVAVATYEKIRDAYKGLEYDVIDVPFGSVEDRAEFILSHVRD